MVTEEVSAFQNELPRIAPMNILCAYLVCFMVLFLGASLCRMLKRQAFVLRLLPVSQKLSPYNGTVLTYVQ
jgi:hypothetical protein